MKKLALLAVVALTAGFIACKPAAAPKEEAAVTPPPPPPAAVMPVPTPEAPPAQPSGH
ncbi:MAG: hypothetical protein HYU98_05955 [Deltaproteobacteria bacterium]|nr:hypothetical protein [Deltaproteobacteria bacterium]